MAGDGGGAVNVEGLDGLESPGLALFPLGLGPADGLPVGRQNQARAGVGDLHAVSPGLVNIQEKRLLDGVLVRAGLDLDSVLQENIGGEQNFLAAVDRVGYVMEAALGSSRVLGIRKVVAFVSAGHPHGGLDAAVEHDLLGEAKAQVVFEKFAIGLDIHGQAVPVIQAAYVATARRESLGLI